MIQFTIQGEPQGKSRPRFNRSTGTAYTPKETKEYEKKVAESCRSACRGVMYHGAVSVAVTAYYGVPKSASRSAQMAMLDDTRRPQKKPDIDNVVKVVLDGMTGVMFEDDKQVVSIVAAKFYAIEPKVVVIVDEV